MTVDIKVPAIGESITEGLLAAWSVQDGSHVIEGQALFELETDKTTIDVTAPATGTLIIAVSEGTEVSIEDVVGAIDTQAKPLPERQTPGAKAAAGAAGIPLEDVKGTGRNGMVTKADIPSTEEAPRPEPPPKPAAEPKTQAVGETRKPLSRIRKAIAANLKRTQDELVLLTTFNEADMSGVKALRARYGERFKDRHGVKLGFMSFFLKASAGALQVYPEINARIEGDQVIYPQGIHISVAVSTPKGLVTPVVRNVESKSFAGIEREILDFSKKATDKTLMPDDLRGGTFTVTNGGIFGSMMSTPLPAPQQSAILGMHAIIDRPIAVDASVVVRPMMYLALSYDHRLVDGREAVGCLKAIKEAVEHPERLLLEV